jgi:hypothetical protein
VKPDPIGDNVRRELARFGPAAGMTEIVRSWPDSVGAEIARNAWPARLSCDGTLHVATSSSAWAFELAQLEPKLLERLAERLESDLPRALRFAPGKLPEPAPDAVEGAPKQGPAPSAEARRRGEELAAVIEDENLRKIVAKAAASSLARGP